MSDYTAGIFTALCLEQGGTMPYVAGVSCKACWQPLSAQHTSKSVFAVVSFLEKNSSGIWWNPKCATFFFAVNK